MKTRNEKWIQTDTDKQTTATTAAAATEKPRPGGFIFISIKPNSKKITKFL